jgi:serine/threonine protein kinase
MLFGKYCLLERISVGGMAEVFRAKPLPAEETGKMLALKRILPHLAEDEEFITMFVDEAKLTVQLKHPNIVETYELGNFQGSYYIVMEYIAGADVLTLQKRLRKRRRIMSVAQACYVAQEVAKGLQYAHTKCDEEGRPFNIIHRDVSPQNIRLTYDGRVKLIDFGIAKAAVQRTKTQVGVLKGKFGYMSPEQVRGDGEIDHRSDVFALGTCLWEMLTNRRLFNGENEFETLQMVKQCNFPPPSEKNGQVPPEVDDIVMRALEPDPDRRYGSAQALAEDLSGFLEGIDQPYTSQHLQQWMADTFSEELGEERRKRDIYNEIRTPTDVKNFEELIPEDAELEELIEGEEGEAPDDEGDEGVEVPEDEVDDERTGREEDDELWDPDFAPDEEDVDPEEFASNHTQVAAGGFDPSVFEGEDDDVMEIADEDVIEVEEGEFDEAELEDSVVEAVESQTNQPSGAVDEPGAASVSDDDVDMAPEAGQASGPPEQVAARAARGEEHDGAQGARTSTRGGDTGPQQPSSERGTGRSEEPARLSAAGQASKQTASGDLGGGAPESGESTRSQRTETNRSQQTHADTEGNSEDSGSSDRVWRLVAAAAMLTAFFGLAATAFWVMRGSTQTTSSGEGTLVVNTNPKLSSGGSFLVNGSKRGETSPVYVSGLDPEDDHTVKVRHPAYSNKERENIMVEPGQIKSITMELETDPDARGRLTIRLENAPEDATVYVDGKEQSLETVRDRLALEQGEHLIEVTAPGYELWSRVIDVSAGERLVEQVRLEKLGVALRVTAPDESAIVLDGERVGTGTVRVGGLDPREIHEIEVESASGEDAWESALGYPRMADGVLEIDFDDPPEARTEEDFGWVTARTGGDWWELYIDGARTGLRTPVGDDDKVPVSSGSHTVMFRRGNAVERVDIEIEAGDTHEVEEDFAFEWNGQMNQ